jgi:hypothetical protein
MPGINLGIKVRWTKLDANRLMAAVEGEAISAMEGARKLARSILIRNVGTQYFSLEQLRGLGYPYSHRSSSRPGNLPDGIVNRQSGGFYKSFFIRVAPTGKRVSLLVGQSGAEQMQGLWLQEGTTRMRGRNWQRQLRLEMARVIRPYLAKTLNERLKLTVKAFGVNSFPKG